MVKETWKERFLFVSSHFNVSKERERERERERIKKKGKPSRAIHEVEITWFLIINFSFFASISLTLADFVHNLQYKSTISHRMHVGLIKSNPFLFASTIHFLVDVQELKPKQ